MSMTSATMAWGLLGLFLLAGTGCSRSETKALPLILAGRVDPQETVDPEETPHVLGGGRDASDPAVVAVLGSHGGLCTGTLIAPRFVLTAQHCVEGESRVSVAFGARSRQGARIPTRIHLPPRTFTLGRSNDIAVLEMAQPSTVTPIPVNLSERGLDQLSRIRVVGYGVTGTDNEDAGIKRSGSVRATVTRSYVESVGTDGSCFGDSGGPALAVIGGREQLVAVTSHGTARRCEDGRGRYVRTDVHRAFLSKFVADDARAPGNDPVAERPQAPVLPEPPAPVVPSFPAGLPGANGLPGASGSGSFGTSSATATATSNGVVIVTNSNGTVHVTTIRTSSSGRTARR